MSQEKCGKCETPYELRGRTHSTRFFQCPKCGYCPVVIRTETGISISEPEPPKAQEFGPTAFDGLLDEKLFGGQYWANKTRDEISKILYGFLRNGFRLGRISLEAENEKLRDELRRSQNATSAFKRRLSPEQQRDALIEYVEIAVPGSKSPTL